MNLYEGLLQRGLELNVSGIKLFLSDVTATDQVLHVEGADAALVLNQVVHQRLGHRRVITLIVTTATVANDVDYNVLVEDLAVFKCQTRHPNHSLWVITIDVEDWCLNRLSDVGCVGSGTRILWQGGETNLVVHDDVNGAANLVALKLAHLQRLRNNTLTSKCRVTVDQNWHNRIVIWVT